MLWSFLMPFFIAFICSNLFARQIFMDKFTKKAILKTREILMSEREIERTNENQATLFILNFITKAQKTVDLESLIFFEFRNMLNLMGLKTCPEKEMAKYIIKSFIGSLPILAVPILTGFLGYTVLYPVFVAILIYQQYLVFRNQFKKWQTETVKDLPDLIDKLRISFASGRDYISAFNQAKENSSERMNIMIDKLINDFRFMRPSQALDLFAQSFRMPVVTRFASAVKIAVEYGYEKAENYFCIIESDITELRQVSIEELTKSKPEKVYQLYLILLLLAISSLAIKGWEIFSQVNKIM